jgi:hypothetical protein
MRSSLAGRAMQATYRYVRVPSIISGRRLCIPQWSASQGRVLSPLPNQDRS